MSYCLYVLHFVKQLNGTCTEFNHMNPIILHSSEITEAELTWITVIQLNSFTVEILSVLLAKIQNLC